MARKKTFKFANFSWANLDIFHKMSANWVWATVPKDLTPLPFKLYADRNKDAIGWCGSFSEDNTSYISEGARCVGSSLGFYRKSLSGVCFPVVFTDTRNASISKKSHERVTSSR